MRYLKYLALLGLLVFIPTGKANAQVRVGVGIGVGPVVVGPPPVCVYGYYPYYPFACAPYGYWGPQYFLNSVFIGAGPWFHGFPGPVIRRDFDDRHFDRDFDRDGRRFDDHRGDRGRDFRGEEGFRGKTRGGEFHGGAVRGDVGSHGGSFHSGGRR